MLSTRLSVCALSLVLTVGWSLGFSATAEGRNPAPAASLWGPPVLCHPVHFAEGEVKSLPFGSDAFSTSCFVDRSEVVALMEQAIDARQDTFFHMETLRRGLIYLAWGDDPLEQEIERWVSKLEQRVEAGKRSLEAASEKDVLAERRALGLAAFDLAWTLEGLRESGQNPRSNKLIQEALELALAHRADDDALQLGAAILSFARNDHPAMYKHLGLALRDVEDDKSLLARNADSTIGPFLDVRGAEALLALCKKKSKHA